MKQPKKLIRRIVKNYKRKSDAGVLTFSQNVHSSTSESTLLPNPIPTMEVLGAAINLYSDMLTPSLNRGRMQVALKNDARHTLTELLDELANFVTLTANGNDTILISSGFDLSKIPGSVVINTPQVLVTDGPNPGELNSTAKGAENGKGFVHQVTADPITDDSVWESVTTTRRSYTFKGLQKTKNYWVRVAAIGGNQQMKISKPVSRVVQ